MSKYERTVQMLRSNYKSYCSKCHFSIWKGEPIELVNKKPQHIDCVEALRDKTPRALHKSYQKVYGTVRKSLVVKMLEQRTLLEV